jgi:hypothetical protein
MDRHDSSQSGTEAMLKQLHERPQLPLAEWLRPPAHVHYEAFRMSDPPARRTQSREEFIMNRQTSRLRPFMAPMCWKEIVQYANLLFLPPVPVALRQ